MTDLIKRSDALEALALGDTVMALQRKIAAIPAVVTPTSADRVKFDDDGALDEVVAVYMGITQIGELRMIGLMQLADDAPRMIVDLSYMKDPSWWGRNQTAPDGHEFKNTFSQIDRHRDTASRLIELAAWNMRQAELLANDEVK